MYNIKKILFVCTGNTCRSPMAEYIFNYISETEGLGVTAISRGIMGGIKYPGDKIYRKSPSKKYAHKGVTEISPEAVEVVQEYNPNILNILDHESRNASLKDIISADLILTMDKIHLSSIRDELAYADYKHITDISRFNPYKVFTLKEYAGSEDTDVGISDPMGTGNHEFYDGPFEEEFNVRTTRKKDDKNVEDVNEKRLEGYRIARDDIISCIDILVQDLSDPKMNFEKIFQRIKNAAVIRAEKIEAENNNTYTFETKKKTSLGRSFKGR